MGGPLYLVQQGWVLKRVKLYCCLAINAYSHMCLVIMLRRVKAACTPWWRRREVEWKVWLRR